MNYKDQISLDKDAEINELNGGVCSVFDILEELKIALKDDKEVMERVLTTIKPDILLTKCDNMAQLSLDYSSLKVTNRIARMGKDIAWVFNQFDSSSSGLCKYHMKYKNKIL